MCGGVDVVRGCKLWLFMTLMCCWAGLVDAALGRYRAKGLVSNVNDNKSIIDGGRSLSGLSDNSKPAPDYATILPLQVFIQDIRKCLQCRGSDLAELCKSDVPMLVTPFALLMDAINNLIRLFKRIEGHQYDPFSLNAHQHVAFLTQTINTVFCAMLFNKIDAIMLKTSILKHYYKVCHANQQLRPCGGTLYSQLPSIKYNKLYKYAHCEIFMATVKHEIEVLTKIYNTLNSVFTKLIE